MSHDPIQRKAIQDPAKSLCTNRWTREQERLLLSMDYRKLTPACINWTLRRNLTITLLAAPTVPPPGELTGLPSTSIAIWDEMISTSHLTIIRHADFIIVDEFYGGYLVSHRSQQYSASNS